MKTAKRAPKAQASSGNVFSDLGLRNPQERLLKAQLANQVCQAIAARGLTQAKAAAIMGLDQPKVSALMHGKLRGFAAERLFQCLNDLGREVEITTRPAHAADRGVTHVVVAAE